MTNLLLTPRSEKDLEEIFTYTSATWGIAQAERYQEELFHGMHLILEDHELGVRYPYANFDYRKLHVYRHLIFYKYDGNECRIIRI